MKQLDTIQKRENLNVVLRRDELGPGAGFHDYVIVRADTQEIVLEVPFQKGPRKADFSRQGVLDCDLMEIVRDRLKAFQDGPMASRENEKALEYIEKALEQMNKRVEDRIKRNVLGTMKE